ncbi:MAG: UDP-N-acetylmuramoyl-tripeptide--D-alanyl-D-alanine ligase [Lachnospiraceae bacterium]|nr:UDP-N-acetylmuramoyl-tripeptide--D-alanyl-D-alanine ligase [Lachnospiraceae bacterium]
MRAMTLPRIAKAVDGKLFINGKRYYMGEAVFPEGTGINEAIDYNECSSLVIDSRKIEKDSVFVATVGAKVDGHSFIAQVFEKGAMGVICEKGPADWGCIDFEDGKPVQDFGNGMPYIIVENSFDALKKLATYYRSVMSDVKCVGIVGSVGKTSTKELVASVLSQHFRTYKTEGNFNNEVGVPLTVLSIRDEHEAAVIEMGISDFGEMDRLGAIVKPDAVVMTNIGPCHLEKLIDLDGVLRAKTECIKHMAKDGFLVLNRDDEKLAAIKSAGRRSILYYGSAGDVSAEEIESLGLEGSRFIMNAAGQKIECMVPLPGKHMVWNALAAAAVGLELGMEITDIAAGIAAVKPVSGRSNLIRTDNYLVVDDCYNANPKSMKAAIDLMGYARGRKCAILGDMFELGGNAEALHAEVGEYAAGKIDFLICVGELSRNMYDSYQNGNDRENADAQALYFESTEELAKHLAELKFMPQDTILVKASHGMEFSKIVRLLTAE